MSRDAILAQNLAAVAGRIVKAETRAGRTPGSVKLVAVSKKMPAEDVVSAISAGQIDFGENYAQELRDKRLEVAARFSPPATNAQMPRWHFIGPLQTNKVKYVAGQASLLHALDTVALLDEVNRRVPQGQVQSCLLQVNVAAEPQKRGVSPQQLPALLDHFQHCAQLVCEGLMVIPPIADEPEQSREHFRRLRELLTHHAAVARPRVKLRELSMGMSDDLEVAIEEGATMVRVGTAVFGQRPG